MEASIDIGNSRIKVGFFKETDLVEHKVLEEGMLLPYLSVLNPSQIIISSVAGKERLVELIQNRFSNVHLFSKNTPIPMSIDYATPETLGIDRLAAAVGALQHFQGPLLVIDAGSCITCDLIDESNVYKGGSISPGLAMRLQSMHTFTESLPLLELEPPEPGVPDSTRKAMLSGAITGARHEIIGFINQYKALYPEIKVIICGGDVNYFDKMNELNIFVLPNLVLAGLNAILRFNGED